MDAMSRTEFKMWLLTLDWDNLPIDLIADVYAAAIREAEADALERAARLAERVRTGDAPWAPHQVADAVRSLRETTPNAKGGGK